MERIQVFLTDRSLDCWCRRHGTPEIRPGGLWRRSFPQTDHFTVGVNATDQEAQPGKRHQRSSQVAFWRQSRSFPQTDYFTIDVDATNQEAPHRWLCRGDPDLSRRQTTHCWWRCPLPQRHQRRGQVAFQRRPRSFPQIDHFTVGGDATYPRGTRDAARWLFGDDPGLSHRYITSLSVSMPRTKRHQRCRDLTRPVTSCKPIVSPPAVISHRLGLINVTTYV